VVWVWILLAGAVLVAIAAFVAWEVVLKGRRERTAALKARFGPEYERMVRAHESRAAAEDELEERIERRQQLDLRPLAAAARDRYLRTWHDVQAQFVDAPETAVASADGLIVAVMRDRGYPVDDFDQRAGDLSVDHPRLVQNYHAAHSTAERSARGEASTDDLREAMQQYRSLFDELLDAGRADGRSEKRPEEVPR
jgi:hypothetical protein